MVTRTLPAPRRRNGLLAAAVVLFTLAALTMARAMLPADLVVDTWDTGFAQFLAFYLTLLGVGLLQADEAARKFVCLAAVPLLAVGVLVLATAAGADKLPGGALATLGGGLVLALLGRDASAGRAGTGAALAATGGLLFFPAEIVASRAPREEARRKLAEWRSPDPAFARVDLGVRIASPEGWVVLRPGSPYVPADPADVVALYHDASGARALVRVDPELVAAETLDAALDRQVEGWRAREPELEEGRRADVALGDVPGRRVYVRWKRDKATWAGHLVTWKDASRTLVLAAWYDAGKLETGLPEVERIIESLSVTRPLTGRIAVAAAAAGRQMPQMTPRALELLVARRPDADAPALFRESLAAASLGFERLDRELARDMGEINGALYARMPAADSVWMADYVRRVRAIEPTTAEEDARAMRAMAEAASRLPPASRERLREILESAVVAVVHG